MLSTKIAGCGEVPDEGVSKLVTQELKECSFTVIVVSEPPVSQFWSSPCTIQLLQRVLLAWDIMHESCQSNMYVVAAVSNAT